MDYFEDRPTAHGEGVLVDKVVIVIVTYERQQLLAQLLDSVLMLSIAPWKVVLVDNENSSETASVAEAYAAKVAQGQTAAPWPEASDPIIYVPMSENTGGAGGFSKGVEGAFDAGAEWLWLMDDDVQVLPDALEKLARWMPDHGMIQGSRLDYDGGAFYWQYRFWTSLGIYNPFASANLGPDGFKPANAACFEGGLFARSVVEQIGLPDPRFFIYWDDCVYGYLASKVASAITVSDVILQRARGVRNWEVSTTRQLNSSSDETRFYIMRNRGYIACYLRAYGDYHRIVFGIGTILSFAKEIIRLLGVDRGHFRSGMARLVAGWRASRVLIHDRSWEPMPKLG